MSNLDDFLAAWRNYQQYPRAEVWLRGARTLPAGISITFSLDSANASCRLMYDEYPEFGGLQVPVQVYLGYGPYLLPAFTGTSETTERSYGPHNYEIQCSGFVKRMRYNYGGDDIPWIDETMQTIITDLMMFAGVPAYSVDARTDFLLGTLQPLWLRNGQAPWSLAERLAQDWGYKIFDTPDGTVRVRRINGLPAENAAFEITEGEMGFSFTRPRSTLTTYNQALVSGLPVGYFIPKAIRQDPGDPANLPHPWIPNPPGYIPVTHSSDLLETLDQVEEVAQRLMFEYNHVAEEMSLSVPGNPLLIPGMTLAVEAPSVGLVEPVNYFLQSVTHEWSESGFFSNVDLRGGIGAPGEPGDPYGTGLPGQPPIDPGEDPDPPSNAPEPVFTYTLHRQSFYADFENGEVPDAGPPVSNRPVLGDDGRPVINEDGTWQWEQALPGETGWPIMVRRYTFNGDALGSYAPDSLPTDLTFSWSNSHDNPGHTMEGGRFYGTQFTRAQMEGGGCSVTLTVTDSVGRSRTVTRALRPEEATIRFLSMIHARTLWASGDGGETWKDFGIPPRENDIEEDALGTWCPPRWSTWNPDTNRYEIQDWGGLSIEGKPDWLDTAKASVAWKRQRMVYIPTHRSPIPSTTVDNTGIPWAIIYMRTELEGHSFIWRKLLSGTTSEGENDGFGGIQIACDPIDFDTGWYHNFGLPPLMAKFVSYEGCGCYDCRPGTALSTTEHRCQFGIQAAIVLPNELPAAALCIPPISPPDTTYVGTVDGRVFAVRGEWQDGIVGGEWVWALDPTLSPGPVFDISDPNHVENVVPDSSTLNYPVTAIWVNEADHGRITIAVQAPPSGGGMGSDGEFIQFDRGMRLYRSRPGYLGPNATGTAAKPFWERIPTTVVDDWFEQVYGVVYSEQFPDLKVNETPPVRHIVESAFNPGEYRISFGSYNPGNKGRSVVFLTHDDFKTAIPLPGPPYDFAPTTAPFDTNIDDGEAFETVQSPFGNYIVYRSHFVADADPSPTDEHGNIIPKGAVVREEDGSEIVLPDSLPAIPNDLPVTGTYLDDAPEYPTNSGNQRIFTHQLRSATAHIRTDALWTVTGMGEVLYKPSGQSAFTHIGTLDREAQLHGPMYWEVNGIRVDESAHWHGPESMLRDGSGFLTHYIVGRGGWHATWLGGQSYRTSIFPPGYMAFYEYPRSVELPHTHDYGFSNSLHVATHLGYGSPEFI